MSNFAQTRTSYDSGDRRWARNFLALDTHDVTLDGSKFPAGTVVPSGTHIGKVTASGLGARIPVGPPADRDRNDENHQREIGHREVRHHVEQRLAAAVNR